MPSIGRLALGAAILSLSGCGFFAEPVSTPPCPRVAVLSDAARIVKFQPGPGRDLIDVIFEGQFLNVEGTCAYDLKRSFVDLEFTLSIEMTQGPANADRRASAEYFVAIVDPNQNILGKEKFAIATQFRGNANRAILQEDIAPRLPLKDVKIGGAYSVLVGFQLSPDDLDYMRRRGR